MTTDAVTYAKGRETRLRILEMGMRLWMVDASYVTARRIAHELGMAHSTVCYHFARGEHSLRDAVAHYAVQQGEARVIAQLIAAQHKAAAHLSDAQRLEVMRQAAMQ